MLWGFIEHIWGFCSTIIEDKEDIQDTMGCNADIFYEQDMI
jgi:hypothetical protein